MDKSADNANDSNLPVRAYLDKTVVPILLAALSECSKQRPQYPVEFIANYLIENNPEKKNWALKPAETKQKHKKQQGRQWAVLKVTELWLIT